MSETAVHEGPQVLRPEDGSPIAWFGSLMTIKVTDPSHSVVEVVEPPGAGSPVHVHVEDETFCVLEGEYTIRCGDLEAVAAPGTIARLPRGIPHTHWVTGDGNARALMIFAPGGFEQYFAEAGTPTDRRELPAPTAPDPARLAAIGQRYGLQIVGPPPGH